MKTIGYTNDGKVLLEATEDENRLLCELEKILQGWDLSGFDVPRKMDSNMESAFHAIRLFMFSKDFINRMLEAAKDLNTQLMRVE